MLDPRQNSATGSPSRILVVDDDDAVRSGLTDLLNLEGYHAIGAGNFREALDFLRSTAPDLLITDIRLEGYNGLHLVLSRPEGVPAIVITGHDDPVLAADARRCGAAYMLKPVNPEQFLTLVKGLLNRAETDRK